MHNFKKMIIPFILVLALIVGMVPVCASGNNSPTAITLDPAATTASSVTFTGSARYPSIRVVDSEGYVINPANYSVKYENNVNVGTGTATIRMMAPYSGTVTVNFTIKPAKAKYVASKTVKAKTVKAKKVGVTMVTNIKTATVTKVSGSSKLTVTKSGKVYVKKGTKKGTYKIKVQVTGPNHVTTTKTLKVVVK